MGNNWHKYLPTIQLYSWPTYKIRPDVFAMTMHFVQSTTDFIYALHA